MEIVGNFQFNRSDIIGQGASGIVFKGCSILVSIVHCCYLNDFLIAPGTGANKSATVGVHENQ